jgi:hypothetical protein
MTHYNPDPNDVSPYISTSDPATPMPTSPTPDPQINPEPPATPLRSTDPDVPTSDTELTLSLISSLDSLNEQATTLQKEVTKLQKSDQSTSTFKKIASPVIITDVLVTVAGIIFGIIFYNQNQSLESQQHVIQTQQAQLQTQQEQINRVVKGVCPVYSLVIGTPESQKINASKSPLGAQNYLAFIDLIKNSAAITQCPNS